MQTGGNALRGLFQVGEELVPQGPFRFSDCSLEVVGASSGKASDRYLEERLKIKAELQSSARESWNLVTPRIC